MNRRSFCLLWLFCFNVAAWSVADEVRVNLSNREVAAIDAAMQNEIKRQQLVGAAIGVIRNGRVVFTRGYGFADLEKKRKMTTETVVNWASNSKPVVAMLAMQLVEQNKLDLDRDVREYVPEFPDKGSKITTRQLLSHQSGIPHYSNGRIVQTPGRRSVKQELDPVIAIQRFDRSPLIFQPGSKMDYSSHAYVLLSAVVQRAGGEPIQDQLDKRIVTPLKLTSLQLDLPTKGQRSWATGYYKNSRGQVVPAQEYSHAWKHGAGAYKSNINDFARWAVANLNGELIKRRTQQQMWTNQTLSNGQKIKYGLGPVVEGAGSSLKISHNGSQRETKTRMVIYPNQRHGMVCMTNCNHGDPGAMTTAVYRALASAR